MTYIRGSSLPSHPTAPKMRCGGSISATVHPKGFGMGTLRGSLTTAYIPDLRGANF